MTMRILTGTYSAGYSLQSPITTLSIAAGGYVEGSGIATVGGATTSYAVINDGRIRESDSDQANAVYLNHGGGVTNGSGADTAALIEGWRGVWIANGAGAVTNFGTIIGDARSGIVLKAGGVVTNGSARDTSALIEGARASVGFSGEVGTLTNFGTLVGEALLRAGGAVINGSAADTTALILAVAPYDGVDIGPFGTVTNFGTIKNGETTGHGVGVLLNGANLTNGAAGVARAIVEGLTGVYAGPGAAATVTNFGTIEGDVNSVKFASSGDVLVAQSGARFVGAVARGGGTFELSGGSGTVGGLGGAGVVSGSVSANFGGFADYVIGAGGAWTLAGVNTVAANQSLTIDGALAVTGTLRLAHTLATLDVGAGGSVVFSGRSEALSGTIAGAGTVTFTGGSDVFNGSTLSAAHMTIDGAAVSLKGTVTNSGDLIIETNTVGAGAGGASLINQSGGTIEAFGGAAVTLATGAIVNAGTLEADGGGLTVTGAVSGTGVGVVKRGTLAFGATFSENVTFAGTSGVLQLAKSQGYGGAIAGFSLTGGTSLDLRDIAFKSAGEATFSGTATSGTLTVTDGTHTAHITLIGDYRSSTFTVSSDGNGGVIVVDPTKSGPSSHQIIAAMASLGAVAGESVQASRESWREHPVPLTAPRVHIA